YLPSDVILAYAALHWIKTLFRQLPKQPHKDALGQRSENAGAKFLRNAGYKIICRNFRCGVGEIDIVARDGKTLVFAEVKTRVDDEPTLEDQVNPTKQYQLTKSPRFCLWRYGTQQPLAR